jgi:hypothetical protein
MLAAVVFECGLLVIRRAIALLTRWPDISELSRRIRAIYDAAGKPIPSAPVIQHDHCLTWPRDRSRMMSAGGFLVSWAIFAKTGARMGSPVRTVLLRVSAGPVMSRRNRGHSPDSQRPWLPKGVGAADLSSAFDRIGHDRLLDQIGLFPARGQIRKWLKAGVVDKGRYSQTEEGTPQGGLCSATHNDPNAQCRVMRSAGLPGLLVAGLTGERCA